MVQSVFQPEFSCALSMHDGVVMYTTHNLTTSLGFPKEMWIGRSFIDFVHPKVSQGDPLRGHQDSSVRCFNVILVIPMNKYV